MYHAEYEGIPKWKGLEVPVRESRGMIAALAVIVALVATLCFASPASAACGWVIFDFVPGHHAISCSYDSGPEETWTVPANITKPRFGIHGADDAVGGSGGFVSAKLPVKAGQILDLKMGSSGAASSVSRSGKALLVAGGGNGVKPNYLSPEAEPLEIEEPGQPVGPYLGDGRVFIEWYDARTPFDLVDPLPSVIVDIFDSEKDSFQYTGLWEKWTVPDGVELAAFELWGGRGDSSEPHGHILAGFDVIPGETFYLRVGGPGEDTQLSRPETFEAGLAAGGDTERPNYLPWGASYAQEFWEGGGSESESGNGYARVHYWPPEESGETPPEDKTVVGNQPFLAFSPPGLSQRPASVCIVPSLRNKTPRAARRALANASCQLSKVNRRPAAKRMWGRVVHQAPSPGTIAPPKGVTIAVGSSRHPG
jgi:hypothetical protein